MNDNNTPADNPTPEPNHTDETAQSQPITIDTVLEILEQGDITHEHGLIRWSSNRTLLLSITHNDITIEAIYKPRLGERPLWDFPDGTLANRERASFLTSEVLEWHIVPPTVIRNGPNGVGSMQFFVEHDPNHTYFEFDESLLPQLARISLFDALVNNADRKGGHCILGADGHIWGIDQGLTFNEMHKLRTVIWNFAGQTIPDVLLADVEMLCGKLTDSESDYRKQLAHLISESEIEAFNKRINRLLNKRTYPQPGPGPNYPWPPV